MFSIVWFYVLPYTASHSCTALLSAAFVICFLSTLRMHSASSFETLTAALLSAWKTIPTPFTQQPLITTQNLHIETDAQTNGITARITLPYPARSLEPELAHTLRTALPAHIDASLLTIRFASQVIARAVQPGLTLIPGVKNIIAIASAKGGVGKSTSAVNLALALALEGAHVGLLDADIYGPSIPLLLNLNGQQPDVNNKQLMVPLHNYGIQAMSIGLLVTDDDRAMIWRAPVALRALNQLLTQTQWGDPPDNALDYLIVDMPPGTGDIQISMNQRVPLTGAVAVTTPQDIALLDVRKGINMFQKMHIPVLGVLENMAVHICSQCGHQEHIFGMDGGKKLAQAHGIPYLGTLPLALPIRQQADAGIPIVAAEPDGEIARIYRNMALQIAAQIASLPPDHSHKFPPIRVQS